MDDVHTQINAELALIPSFHQNMLRARYQMTRAHALGAKSDGPLSAREVLELETALRRKDDPAFEPRYAPALIGG